MKGCVLAKRPLVLGGCVVVVFVSLIAGTLVGLGAATSSAATGLAAARPPNIVVIMADDMRVDDLRFMPRTRRHLARHGIEFTNSFSPNPLCCPARASFLTGQYSHNHKVYSHKAPWGFRSFDDSYTMPTALKASGYKTALVGKYVNGYGTQRSVVSGGPSARYVPNGYTDWYAALDTTPGSPASSTYDYRNVAYSHNGRIDASHRGEYSTNGIGRISRRLIVKYSRGDAPFFVYASYVAPHFGGPREPDDPASFRAPNGSLLEFKTPARPVWVRGKFDRVLERAAGIPRGGGPTESDMSDKPRHLRNRPELGPRARAAVLESARQRAESLFVLDLEVNRTVQTLKAAGEWDNTVLIFTSDNGYFLGEHRYPAGKGTVYEPSIRVPLLLTGPGLRTGEKRHDPITTVDLTATITDLGNATGRLTGRYPIDGQSRLSTLFSGDQGWRTPVVTEGHIWSRIDRDLAHELGFQGNGRSFIGIRTARYSYVRYIRGDEELYDLATDANQLTSVHSKPAFAAVKTALVEAWTAYRNCRGASCRTPLPASLQADALPLRELTLSFWKQVQARYGD